MRQIRLGTTLAAVMLLGACSDDDSRARPQPPDEVGAAPTGTTTSATDYRVPGPSQLNGPARFGVPAFGDADAPMAVFDVPAGFHGHESWVWTDEQGPRAFAQLAYWAPTRVLVDPCDSDTPSPPLGPTVADLAAALAGQTRTTTTAPIRVTLDGHRGLYLELTTPDRFDDRACGADAMQIWEVGTDDDGRALEESLTDRYWIVDVDGRRVVISGVTHRAATRETVERLSRVAETTVFVDPD